MFNVPQYSGDVSRIKWHAFTVYILDQILALEIPTEHVLDGHMVSLRPEPRLREASMILR